MHRIVITGANGVGKSYLAAQLSTAQPTVPVISFDAIKLKTDWRQNPTLHVARELDRRIHTDRWILEGGPTMLPKALPLADEVIWLDPPEIIRAWRLLMRPWKARGKTRLELPPGNIDWPMQQYRFARKSLTKRAGFRTAIQKALASDHTARIWRCRTKCDVENFIVKWAA